MVSGSAEISHCTFADNAGTRNEKEMRASNGQITMIHCVISARCDDVVIVGGPQGEFTVNGSNIDTGDGSVWPGEGNINVDPLFVTGPEGDYYLSQTAAGQAEDSPCVDTGDPQADLFRGSTRTDEIRDRDVLDMGYHYPAVTQPLVTTGARPDPGNPPLIRVFPPAEDAEHEFTFLAYGVPAYGVNVAGGDPDGDGVEEILTGAGPGAVFGPHVRGFEVEGGPMPGLSFLAYGTNKYGVNVATGDLDGDGRDEIITGAGPGVVFGPHVRGWNYDGDEITSLPGFSFFAWGTDPLHFGVNVWAGTDLNSDGRDEVVAGRGPDPDANTEVKVFTYDGSAVSLWFSLEAYPGLTHGTNVAAGAF